MKNHRDVCKATDAGYATFDSFPGQVKTGCQKTPDFKSRYCCLHKPRVCTLSKLPVEDDLQEKTEGAEEGVVEMILEKKITRNITYYKVKRKFANLLLHRAKIVDGILVMNCSSLPSLCRYSCRNFSSMNTYVFLPGSSHGSGKCPGLLV